MDLVILNRINFSRLRAACFLIFPLLLIVLAGTVRLFAATGLTLQVTPSRTSGVAPLAVYFDAAGTLSTATTHPFTEVNYAWDFGDPTSGFFSTTGLSKNAMRGSESGHVFETPGTYTVTLTGKDALGQVATQTVTITVTDPATVYAGTNTVCFSPTGNFTGAPVGCTRVTASTLAAIQPYVVSNVRLLLHSGETFTDVAGGLDFSGTSGGTVGSYDTGARPIIIGSGAVVFNPEASDWRVMDIDVQGNGSDPLSLGYTSTVNFLMLRVRATNIKTAFLSSGQLPDVPAIVDCELYGSGTGAATVYTLSHRLIILGNVLRSVGEADGQHVVRVPQADRAVFADNDFADIQPQGLLLKLHAPHNQDSNGNAIPWGSTTPIYTQDVVITNNLFHGTLQDIWIVTIGPQNAGFDERLRDIVVDGNFFEAVDDNVTSALNLWSTQDASVRNNIFTGTGLHFGTAISAGCEEPGTGGTYNCGANINSDHILVLNNTCNPSPNHSGSLECFINDNANDVIVANNLGVGTTTLVSSSGSYGVTQTASNNLQTNSPAFISSVPKVSTDFQLTASSPAVNYGIPEAGEEWDYWGGTRDSEPDLGAFEFGSTAMVRSLAKLTPSITVLPALNPVAATSILVVTGAVSGTGATPTGTVILSGGGYTSGSIPLSSGNYSITIPANNLVAGSDTLTVTYSGDTNYNSAFNSAPVTVTGLAAAATPAFSLAAGSYTGAQSVTISSASTGAGAIICYSFTGTPRTNGAGGCAAGTLYSGAVSVSASETLSAVAGGTGFTDSAVGSAAYIITTSAATPAFSLAAGSYTGAQSVTISSSSTGAGAIICYSFTGTPRTNGAGGCAAGTLYSGAVSVSASETLSAVAGGTGFTDSAVGSAAYIITTSAATPAFSLAAGSYTGAQSVTISSSSTGAGAIICYSFTGTPRTNGAGGCAAGTLYSGAVSVSASETLSAVAGGTGFTDSAVGSAAYIITTSAATPAFSLAAGSYTGAQSVTISSSSTGAGAIICYSFTGTPRTNGAGGCAAGTLYSGAVSVSASETLSAVAGGTGFTDSAVGSAAYIITTSAATPAFSLAAGSYTGAQSVTISSSSAGAIICYSFTGSPRTNGAGGCAAGALYSGAVSVSTSETLSAVAGGTGFTDSAVGSAAYVITTSAATPAFSLAAGSYTGAQSVTISSSSAGAIICYSFTGSPRTNGAGGCAAGTLYSGAVPVSASETLSAVAGGTGFTDSAVGSAAYTITVPVTPTFALSASTPAAVPKGSPATSTITVSTITGYVGTVTLSCSLTSSPAGATDLPTCSAGSSTVNLSNSSNTGTTTVTVTSTSSSAELVPRGNGKGLGGTGGGAVLALLVLLGIPARRRNWRAMLSILALMAMLGSLSACNVFHSMVPPNSGTSSGTYTFAVTGTGSPAVASAPATTFMLTVN